MILHLAWAQCLEELRLQDHAIQLDEQQLQLLNQVPCCPFIVWKSCFQLFIYYKRVRHVLAVYSKASWLACLSKAAT